MRLKICAANWKLNFSPEEARQYFLEWSELKPSGLSCEVVFFTPAYDLPVAAEFAPVEGFHFGPQNIYFETNGAFTGENSAQAVHALGARLTLVGHSERRTLFNETDEMTAKKVKTAMTCGLIPMLCVGETLTERESNQTLDVIKRQITVGLKLVAATIQNSQTKSASAPKLPPLMIAYEPVWAIGTGKVATPEQADDTHAEIRRILVQMLGDSQANKIPILYGGSVKPNNAAELAKKPNLDGFLIGGASLKPKEFMAIASAL